MKNSELWASAWTKAAGPRALEIRVDDPGEPLARAMLDAPWELLANRDGYLVDDVVQLFEVARRIGNPTEAIAPQYGDLQVMFMAAAPEGQSVLDFEAEEAAILQATANLPLQLVVEGERRGRVAWSAPGSRQSLRSPPPFLSWRYPLVARSCADA